jgi:signal transduction histidine kinase
VALSRAVGNLVDNALRYAGAATITLSLDGDEAVIAVEDDGPGIPAERLEEMLEPFARGEASRSAETGGAGLGLAIARAVAEGHGGMLRLTNRPGGGLRAEVRLPAA